MFFLMVAVCKALIKIFPDRPVRDPASALFPLSRKIGAVSVTFVRRGVLYCLNFRAVCKLPGHIYVA